MFATHHIHVAAMIDAYSDKCMAAGSCACKFEHRHLVVDGLVQQMHIIKLDHSAESFNVGFFERVLQFLLQSIIFAEWIYRIAGLNEVREQHLPQKIYVRSRHFEYRNTIDFYPSPTIGD